MIKKRKPIIAIVLCMIFGPFGFAYQGVWYLILALLISVLITTIRFIINIPAPEWLLYAGFIAMAWKSWYLCEIRNSLIEEGFKNAIYIKSFPIALVSMLDLIVGYLMFYYGAVGIYYSIKMIVDGKIIRGILILILGVPFLVWILKSIFSFITNFVAYYFKDKFNKMVEK